MYKGNDIISKPIVTFDSGEKIGSIKDIFFDAEEKQLLGFLVDEGGLFRQARVLPFNKIKVIGKDVVTVEHKDSIVMADQHKQDINFVATDQVVKGTRVVTEGGEDLGLISDIYFDDTTGKIVGYEVSGGMFADAYEGKSFLPAPETIRIGKDVAFVPDSVARMMEEQVGGIKGAMQKTSESIKTTTKNTGKKIKDSAERTASATTVDEAIGRRLISDVRATDSGIILAAAGQIVTPEIITQIKEHHKESELLQAVNMTQKEAAKSKTQKMRSSTQEKLQESTTQIKSGLTDAWKNIKTKTALLRDKTTTKMEDNKINEALGRPVSRVILDKEDHVILNTGDLITNHAIDEARQAGVLSMMLSSAYMESPEFSPAEMKATSQGGMGKDHVEIEETRKIIADKNEDPYQAI